MRPVENIIRKFEIDTNSQKDQIVLSELLEAQAKSRSGPPRPYIWRIILKSRITQLAAAIVVIFAVCWLAMSDRGEPEQQRTNGQMVAVRTEPPVELMSVISLSMVFRDGGMEAMEKQFDKAEKKVKPGLKEHITISQLICELENCEKI